MAISEIKQGEELFASKIKEGTKARVLERLETLFEAEKIPYRLISHREAYTASQVAESIHMPGRKFAKVVIVRADGKNVMAVLPSHRQIDLMLFSDLLGGRSVSLVPEDALRMQFPDCEVGAMPPFGGFYHLPVYADALLRREAVIYFRAGSHREVIEMRYQDFNRLVHPLIGHFVQDFLKKVSGF